MITFNAFIRIVSVLALIMMAFIAFVNWGLKPFIKNNPKFYCLVVKNEQGQYHILYIGNSESHAMLRGRLLKVSDSKFKRIVFISNAFGEIIEKKIV